MPQYFTSVEPNGFGFLEADFSTHRIRRVADGKRENLESMTAVATEIYTNPPFQTVKGMASSMKEHLKKHFLTPSAICAMRLFYSASIKFKQVERLDLLRKAAGCI